MKKLLAILSVVTLALLASCGSKTEITTVDTELPVEQTATEEATETTGEEAVEVAPTTEVEATAETTTTVEATTEAAPAVEIVTE